MAWQQLTLEIHASDAERVEALLTSLGAVSICLQDAADQPLLEPAPGETPLWTHPRLSALFDEAVDRDAVSRMLASEGLGEASWAELVEREWERVWLDDFEPMRFGKSLWVCPGDTQPPVPAKTIIALDPGLAFGTGRHATTALCLEWLEQANLDDCAVIDYGCGSGILAIAAALLGARDVAAIDIDEQALIATADNAGRNAVDKVITVATPSAPLPQPADVLIANILAQPLVELAPLFARLVRPGGWLVLSGLLDDQPSWVSPAYTGDFTMDPPTCRAGWARLTGIRKRVHSVSAV
ncbi:MAG: 50S ribosomal protein L11 methyltransferase [Gammaproteobacteria bacterium]|nr:50S ribosomal protein L11 methyltransferase [Gammaproteobacteria bacterium]